MTLFLTERDVRELLVMKDVVTTVEQAFREMGGRTAVSQARVRIPLAGTSMHILPAGLAGAAVIGLKTQVFAGIAARSTVLLYSLESGELLAVVEAGELGRLRTGAASGVATRYMARTDARVAGIVGTGGQARAQLAAVCAVRDIRHALVWGRDPERRERFCREMSAALGIPVEPAETVAAAVRDADVVCTATRASEPVLKGEWLRPGTHLNVIGSNWPERREVDSWSVSRASVRAVDSLEQARLEAGDVILAAADDSGIWESVVELGEIVAGQAAGRRTQHDITLFKSVGIGLEDVAVARLLWDKALATGQTGTKAF